MMTWASASASECVMVSSDETPPIEAKRRAAPPCNCSCGGPPCLTDLDVAPQHALRMAGAERLHRRFFRRKPAGKVNRRHSCGACSRPFRRR